MEILDQKCNHNKTIDERETKEDNPPEANKRKNFHVHLTRLPLKNRKNEDRIKSKYFTVVH